MLPTLLLLIVIWLPLAAGAEAPPAAKPLPELRLSVEELVLANGMRFLLVDRPRARTVAAAWAIEVGSADDPAASTGIAHLLEHMLFKGSHTIGTFDAEREAPLLVEEERLEERQRRSQPGSKAWRDVAKELADVRRELRSLARLGDFSTLYAEAGATEVDARTFPDLTLFHATLPVEALELWFWLESDRLLDPVFRELAAERQVIAEERRQRLASAPTGHGQAELQAALWAPHPYARSPLGDPEDVAIISRPQLRRHFADHYHAGRLTAALVGPLDVDVIRALAERYFGRLAPSPPTHAAAAHDPPPLPDDRRLTFAVDGRSQIEAIWRTVAHGHPHTAALDVVAGVLNGRSGRFFRSLVLDQGLAFAAYALHHPLARGGSFTIVAESRGNTNGETLLAAVDAELEDLRQQTVSGAELERARNQIVTDAFRRLLDPMALALQLLIYDRLGDWRHLQTWPRQVAAVTAGDVQQMARQLLRDERRIVGLYRQRTTTP